MKTGKQIVDEFTQQSLHADYCLETEIDKAIFDAQMIERRRIHEGINALIKSGPLTGNGTDETAERNGIILAANHVFNCGL